MTSSLAVLKTGASGMIAYRLQTRDGSWQWLQTSSRLVYKNSKPDFIICTHRPLMYVSPHTRTRQYPHDMLYFSLIILISAVA